MLVTPQPQPPRRRAGFTLVELMVVLLIAGLLLCAAAPSFRSYLQDMRLRQASTAFFHGAHLTRVLGMRQGRQARMAPLDGRRWENGWRISDGQTVVMQQEALDGIRVLAGSNGGQVIFDASGRSTSIDTWRFASTQNTALRPWHVVINFTGRIRQCRRVGAADC